MNLGEGSMETVSARHWVALLGAMLGGCLEYTALLIGYPALIAIAAGLYLVAFVIGRRRALPPAPVLGPAVSSRTG